MMFQLPHFLEIQRKLSSMMRVFTGKPLLEDLKLMLKLSTIG